MIVLITSHAYTHYCISLDLTCWFSDLYIILIVFEHDDCITIHLIVVFSLILCVDMMIYLSIAWLHVTWLPFSAWLSVACSCRSRIYPLISNHLVSVIAFISVLTFANVRPCVCLYSDRDRLGVGSSDGLYRCLGAFWMRPTDRCWLESDHWRPV